MSKIIATLVATLFAAAAFAQTSAPAADTTKSAPAATSGKTEASTPVKKAKHKKAKTKNAGQNGQTDSNKK